MRNIGIIRHLLSQDATAQLIHTLMSNRLRYCKLGAKQPPEEYYFEVTDDSKSDRQYFNKSASS